MSETIIATAKTNSVTGSEVKVTVDDIVCSISIKKNKFSDFLPIIPSNARVRDGKILYRLKFKACLTMHSNGAKVSNHSLSVKTNRPADSVIIHEKSDSGGELIFTLETRDSGTIELNVTTSGVTSPTFNITLKDAWYEDLFLITGYNVCDENDFSGPLVTANGLKEKHKEDFLYSARGVPMQGTGKDTDGRYIALTQLIGGWHRNARGAPDRVASQTGTSFRYVQSVEGKYGTVRENHSMAVDISVIPAHAKVDIDGVGTRYADDKGSAIRAYHIDNFLGAGAAVVKATSLYTSPDRRLAGAKMR
ncbi:3D domain-containing protein [Janthinobacterium sp. RB2R34]|uniref:3D domain-containing protein n=1 Tax=Janthinobacterium sp. RB2R34 TaxID=3424193 RepID=UPI003F29BC42